MVLRQIAIYWQAPALHSLLSNDTEALYLKWDNGGSRRSHPMRCRRYFALADSKRNVKMVHMLSESVPQMVTVLAASLQWMCHVESFARTS